MASPELLFSSDPSAQAAVIQALSTLDSPSEVWDFLLTALSVSNGGQKYEAQQQLPLVLLRQIISEWGEEFVFEIKESQLTSLQTNLLSSLSLPVPKTANAAALAIGELCYTLTTNNVVWPACFENVVSPRISCANLIALGSGVGEAFLYQNATSSMQSVNLIKIMLESALSSADIEIRTTASKVLVQVVFCLQSEDQKEVFCPVFTKLISSIMANAQGVLRKQYEVDSVVDDFKNLIEIIGFDVNLLRKDVQPLINVCLVLSEAFAREGAGVHGVVDLNSFVDVRKIAFEVLLSLVETSPKMCRRIELNPDVIRRAFEFMIESNEEIQVVGKEALSRIIESSGNSTNPQTIEVTVSCVQSLVTSDIPLHQQKGIIALQILLRCCKWDNIDLNQGDVINTIITFLKSNDCSPLIRSAAAACLSQMCECFSPDIQERHHTIILPLLLMMLDETNNPSLQLRVDCCGTLVSFLNSCPSEIVSLYGDAILGRLFVMMRKSPPQDDSVVASISAIGALSNVLGVSFGKYYKMIMTLLQSLYTSTTDTTSTNVMTTYTNVTMLRCKIFEAMGIIFSSVGNDAVGTDDAVNFMRVVANVNLDGEDDVMKRCLLFTWVRMGRQMGERMGIFLPLVIPTLLASLKQNVDVENREDDIDDLFFDEDVALSSMNRLDGNKVLVRTCELEDLALGLETIVLLLEELQHVMYPFVGEIADAIGNLLSSPHEDVSTFAMFAMPLIVTCVGRAGVGIGEVLEFCVGHICRFLANGDGDSIGAEAECTCFQKLKEVIFFAATDWRTFAGCTGKVEIVIDDDAVEKLARDWNGLNAQQIHAVVEVIGARLDMLLRRRAIRYAESKMSEMDEEFDQEEREMFEIKGKEEAEIQFMMSEVLGMIIKTHALRFVRCEVVAGSLIGKLREMSSETCLVDDRKFAIFIFDDIIEFALDELENGIKKGIIDGIVEELMDGVRKSEGNSGLLLAATHGCLMLLKKHQLVLGTERVADMGKLLREVATAMDGKTGDNEEDAQLNCLEALEEIK